MKLASIALGAAALIALPQAALAGPSTAKNIKSCAAEIEAQLAPTATDTNVSFRKMKGNSRAQTLTFRVEADGVKDRVKCKVGREKAAEILWGDDIKPEVAMSVKAKASTSAGGGE